MTVRARSIAVIAGAELRRVLRGRRGVVLAVLYVGFYLFWGNLLARIAAGAEGALRVSVATLGGGAGEESISFVDLLGGGAGGELAAALVTTPPVALFFLVVSYLSLPLLATLIASDAIAGDIQSGAIRFALTRCGRGSYLAGKMLGQIAVLGLLTAICGALMVALGELRGLAPGWVVTGLVVGRYWCLGLLFGAVFVCAACAISSVATTGGAALLLGVVSLVGWALIWLLGPDLGGVDLARLSPYVQWRSLVIPGQVARGAAVHVAFCGVLAGLAAWALGRRDV